MKTLFSVLSKSFSIPTPEPNDMINFVYWPVGGIVDIEPVKANELICPVCEENNLASLLDPNHEGVGAFCLTCTNAKKYPRKKAENKEIVLYGLPQEFQNASFDFLDNKPSHIIDILKTYAKNAQGFLLMSGNPGLGKTYAAACVMRVVALKNVLTRYIEFGELYQRWLSISPNWLSFLEALQQVPFLIVDDIGHRLTNENFLEFLHLLFNYRKNKNLPTIVITNSDSDKLNNSLKSAIFSRLTSGIIIKFEGADRRKKR